MHTITWRARLRHPIDSCRIASFAAVIAVMLMTPVLAAVGVHHRLFKIKLDRNCARAVACLCSIARASTLFDLRPQRFAIIGGFESRLSVPWGRQVWVSLDWAPGA